jgi:hypothetical protein
VPTVLHSAKKKKGWPSAPLKSISWNNVFAECPRYCTRQQVTCSQPQVTCLLHQTPDDKPQVIDKRQSRRAHSSPTWPLRHRWCSVASISR